MTASASQNLIVPDGRKPNRCLSCGTSVNMDRRRYCSVACRQRLRCQLDRRSGLLKALNTRYATFYFTETMLVMDVLTHESKAIYSYLYPRSPGRSPADDFSRMADRLGSAWWAERRRTNRRYLASRQLLAHADRHNSARDSVTPLEIRRPALIGSSIVQLRLSRSDLVAPGFMQAVKNAFRREAKLHHPDQGGSAAMFMKIQRAYEHLMRWADNPVFVKRRGFPDKWFYDGTPNRWVQPTPDQRVSPSTEP
jgi:hypothetical protein